VKCGACNYKNDEWDSENLVMINDDVNEFIYINGHFTTDNTGYYGGEYSVQLYTCPKCGTVRMID